MPVLEIYCDKNLNAIFKIYDCLFVPGNLNFRNGLSDFTFYLLQANL